MSDIKFYDPDEVAEMLGVSANTVREWLRKGKMAGVKLGGKIWKIRQVDIDQFIQESAEQTRILQGRDE